MATSSRREARGKRCLVFNGEKMTIVTKLIERHKELSKEVERLSKMENLTSNEQKNLKVLKKLKLSYKDAINSNTPL